MELTKYIVSENEPILNILKKMNDNLKGIVFICDDKKLLASVTDGDIRRYIIKNGSLDGKIKNIANYNPVYIYEEDIYKSKKIMEEKVVTSLPILDKNHNIIDIKFLKEDINLINDKINIPVVIMAGGKGTRLKPYTNILPKPLIPIKDKTITEHIIESFEKYGCNNFHMIVNYKKNFIKSYFAEINKKINFVEEEIFLGTGGGLYFLKDKFKESIFLTNCDILIDYDYTKILKKHKESGNIATVICIEKKQNIPYGVIETDINGNITNLKEKPKLSFIVNTGVYILEPDFLNYIPKDTFIHITEIIEKCIKDNKKVGTYILDEKYWLDMGQFDELEKMKERLEI